MTYTLVSDGMPDSLENLIVDTLEKYGEEALQKIPGFASISGRTIKFGKKSICRMLINVRRDKRE